MADWEKFLKKNQGPFIIPPGFSNVTVSSSGGQKYHLSIKHPVKNWSLVSDKGDFIREVIYSEIARELTKYPSITCVFFKTVDNKWLVVYDGRILMLRCVPESDESPQPFRRIKARVLGTVLIFETFDHRDSTPWLIDESLLKLKSDELDDNPPKGLIKEQKTIYKLLLEEEKLSRVPKTEQLSKDILKREGAQLISLQETKRGYKLSFNYQGRQKNVEIDENLVLIDAGMCLSGRDKNYSLDSFLSILHNRDSLEDHDYDW